MGQPCAPHGQQPTRGHRAQEHPAGDDLERRQAQQPDLDEEETRSPRQRQHREPDGQRPAGRRPGRQDRHGDQEVPPAETPWPSRRPTVGAAPIVVVDLSEVALIGSIAAAIIIDVLRELAEHQAVTLVTGRSSAKLFAMPGLSQIVDCFPGRSTV